MVLVGFLPRNDFMDNDFRYGRAAFANRYRPYYEGNYPDYRLRYFVERLDSSDFSSNRTIAELIRVNIRNFSYTYNVFADLYHLKQQQRALALLHEVHVQGPGGKPRSPSNGKVDSKAETHDRYADYGSYSGYYDYQEYDLHVVRFAMERLVEVARGKGRTVVLFTIPVQLDFERYEREGRPPLNRNLEKMAKQVGFRYLDLMEPMRATVTDTRSLYHACDDHWNANGNKVAAEILMKSLPLYARHN